MKATRILALFPETLSKDNGMAKRLLLALLIYSIVITLILTATQLYRQYRLELQHIESDFDLVQGSFVPLLAYNIATGDEVRIRAQLEGIAQIRNIEYLAVHIEGEPRWQIGSRASARNITRTIALDNVAGVAAPAGAALHLVASIDAARERIFESLIPELTENGLKIVLIMLFVLLIVQVMITRHLHSLWDYVRDFDPRQPAAGTGLALQRRITGLWRPDVIDHLADALRTLRGRLIDSHAEMIAAHQQLRDNEERLRLALSVANGGVWDWSVPSGDVLFSPEWAAMLGYDIRDIVPNYAYFESILHAGDHEKARQSMEALTEGKIDSCIAEYRLRHKSGRWVWVECQALVTSKTPANKAMRIVGTMISIDERKNANLRLSQLNEELDQRVRERTADLVLALSQAEQSSEAKSLFLSNMSHELRTPMNAVLGYAQLLLLNTPGNLTSEQLTQLQEILNSGDHLLQLINDLLDLSRIETGKLDLVITLIDAAKIIRSCVDMMKLLANRRGIDITIDIDNGDKLLADEQRLRQVLLNLLSNAIKYNRKSGKITVRCTPTLQETVRIEVQDQGEGILPEDLVRLFKPFERLERNKNHDIEGVGIGLALCKRLVEAMNGSIGVSSVIGEGSVFWIELPAMVADP